MSVLDLKHKQLVKDTIVFAIGNIGSKLILFFMVPLYTNYLTAEEFGTADLVFTISQLLIPFVSVVIFDAVLRFGLSKEANAEDVLLVGGIVFLLGSLVTVAVTPLFDFYIILSQWKWYLCIYVILNMAGSIEMNYLKVKGKNRSFAAISIIQTLVLAILNLALLTWLHLGVEGYLIANVAGCAATVLAAFLAGNIGTALRTAHLDIALMKQMLFYSMPLIINNVSWWVIHSSDKIMIELMIGASALGIYSVATKIPSLINVLISIFSQAWGISTVREIESTNDTKFYAEVFRVFSLIAFGAAIMLTAVIKPFMLIYVGSNYDEAWRYVPFLLASASFSAISSFYGSLYGALKKSVSSMSTTFIAAALNIVLNYLFIQKIGIWGAVLGTVIAYVVVAFIRMLGILRMMKFNPCWRAFMVNSVLVLSQALLISLDWCQYVGSTVVIILFIANNKTTIMKICLKLWRKHEKT